MAVAILRYCPLEHDVIQSKIALPSAKGLSWKQYAVRQPHTIGAMDHLPSLYSPFRQQLEGSWFRSHLNSSAWHTSFQCAVVCVDAHRSVSTACGSRWHRIARRRSRSTLTEVCVHSGSRRHRIARRRSRSTLTEVCVHCGSRRHAYGWFHTRDMGSKPDSVRSLGVSNRADQIKVVNTMSDVHGLWKYIAVCFHTRWTVLVPCTELANIRVHSSV